MSRTRVYTPETLKIIERLYIALDAIIAKKQIRGVQTYCKLYNLDVRNFKAQRKHPDRGWFQVSWLQPLVKNFGISAEWLLIGIGEMFDKTKINE